MVDQVLADGVVAAGHEGELQLGPHTVGAGHEHRARDVARYAVEPAERSEPRERIGVAVDRTMSAMPRIAREAASMSTPASR